MSNTNNPFDNLSIPFPGYNKEGDRLWSMAEFSSDNLNMIMHWRREDPDTLSAKCEGVSSVYIRKILSGERTNPSAKIIRQLSVALKIIFIVI